MELVDILNFSLGSGAVLGLARLAATPYVKKFNKMHETLTPNKGTSLLDMVTRTELKVQDISDNLQLLSADQRATVYLAKEPMFKTDPEGNCIFVNKAYQYFTGLLWLDCMGKGWTRALHPDDVERVSSAFNQAMSSGTEFAINKRWVQAVSGRIWNCKVRATITRCSQGKVLGCVGVVDVISYQDISDEIEHKYISQ